MSAIPPITPASLRRRIDRLERRLRPLRIQENRFSWYRLAVFAAGIIAVWYALARLDPLSARLTFAGAVLAFTIVVMLHRRLDRAILRFEIWLSLRRLQLARLNLDWASLPPSLESSTRIPLDLDLDLTGERSLHQLLDQAVSQEGRLRLQDWLTHPIPDKPLIDQRQTLVRQLAGMPRFRDRLLLNLRLVSKDLLHGERLLRWLEAPFPRRRLQTLLIAGTIIAILNLVLFWLSLIGRLPPYWILSLALGFVFYNYNLSFIKEFLDAVVELDAEMDKFHPLLEHLETYPLPGKEALEQLLAPFRSPSDRPSAMVKRLKPITAGIGLRSNMLFGLLLNLLLPWDYAFALLAGGLRQRLGQLLPVWLETWYDLEALCALADFAFLHPDYAFPEVDAGALPVFQAVGLAHPLIPAESRRSNDFDLSDTGQVCIITGSNMAGKTTFLKTVGINIVLTCAGASVSASSLRLAPFRLQTCIRVSDSLQDGWSYFYAEVQCLKGVQSALALPEPTPLLYLIDELFRGTNNRERLIGSRAYIKSLTNRRGSGLIATHDLELASLADHSPYIHNYHFRDRIEDGRLVFDYQIRPGPCPSTNALRIMEMEGLPVEQC